MATVVREQATVIERLAAAGCVAPRATKPRSSWPPRRPTGARRLDPAARQGEPLAWITGRMRFCGREVAVDAGVYVPRIQSEDLARRAAAVLARSGGWAADLCAGTGAIAHHLQAEVPGASVIAVDIDRVPPGAPGATASTPSEAIWPPVSGRAPSPS